MGQFALTVKVNNDVIMIKIKFIICIAITTSISTTNSRYLLFKLKDESNKRKNISSREGIEIDVYEYANLMAYYVTYRKIVRNRY